MHNRVVVGLLALALLVALGGGVLVWRLLSASAYESAVSAMPAATLRATYTDWSQVRSMADGAALDGESTVAEVDAFVRRAYDQDLTSTSALFDATSAMDDTYGFSVLDASWEMYGQGEGGAVVALSVPDSVDLDEVEANLRSLGYDAPADGAGSGGVWAGSADLLAQTDPSLTPVMTNVVVLHDEHLVLMSDNSAYASSSADVVRGDSANLGEETDGVDDLVDLAEEPASAVLFASDFACEALSMATTDEEEQVAADQLVDRAGGVSPLAGLVMALGRDHALTVGMYFESSDQAAENLRPRVELASGEAVGQGGSFADRFEVASGKESGNTVVLDLQPVGSKSDRRESTLLSDLSSGPVVFAAC